MTTSWPSKRGRRLRLQSQLLILLLGFGALPVAISVMVGYTVSRAAMVEQAQKALIELTDRQADYLGNEIRRQHLLLRTITGQIRPERNARSVADMSDALAGSLPDDGVFDGLRIVDPRDSVILAVALGRTRPRWPGRPLSTDSLGGDHWVAVHRDGNVVIAYLVGVSLNTESGSWRLEGHVPASEFSRLFDVPEHLFGGAELAILDETGAVILTPHEHSAHDIGHLVEERDPGGPAVFREEVEGSPAIVYITQVPETEWVLAAALPLSIVLAPLARLRNASILSGGVLILIILLAARVAAAVVTKPLRELADVASEFGRTGVYHGLGSYGVAEVETLRNSFGYMARMLQRSQEEIEQLHQRELERAQQLATVGELASGVAHEIRNPLTGVLGALEVALRNMTPDDAAAPMLREAEVQLRRIESTTSRLLEYARPPDIRQLVVDGNLLLERAARVIEGTARSADVQLVLQPSPEALPVKVDPELIVQVLVNLLLNAIEAMPGGGTLNVSIARHQSDVEVRVRDSGSGITDEQRAHIFRPFYSTKPTGTGLGLAISDQIVRRHGGTLQLADTSEQGTTFVMSLPGVTTDGDAA
jgi:signal transduction histidine kinase